MEEVPKTLMVKIRSTSSQTKLVIPYHPPIWTPTTMLNSKKSCRETDLLAVETTPTQCTNLEELVETIWTTIQTILLISQTVRMKWSTSRSLTMTGIIIYKTVNYSTIIILVWMRTKMKSKINRRHLLILIKEFWEKEVRAIREVEFSEMRANLFLK